MRSDGAVEAIRTTAREEEHTADGELHTDQNRKDSVEGR